MIGYTISKEYINIILYLIEPWGLALSILAGIFMFFNTGYGDSMIINLKMCSYIVLLMYGCYICCYGILKFLIIDLSVILKEKQIGNQQISIHFQLFNK